MSRIYNNDKEAIMSDIFDVKDTLSVAGKEHAYYSLPKLTETYEHIKTLELSITESLPVINFSELARNFGLGEHKGN